VIAQPEGAAQSTVDSDNVEGKFQNNNDDVIPVPSQFGAVIQGNTLETDFFGEGTVTYRVNSSWLHSGWDDIGLNEEDRAYVKSTDAGDKVLLVSITAENVNVSVNSPRAKEALANCFQISLKKTLEHGDIDIAATYFDNPFREEDGSISEKQYFRYSLPGLAESVDLLLGWVIPARYADELATEEIYLTHTLSGNSLILEFDASSNSS
jgi:hypothetical protein